MPSPLLQDLQEAGIIISDIESYEAGNPVTAPPVTIGTKKLTVTAQQLPSGPVAPFQTIGGSAISIILTVFGDFETISAGAPVSIAFKTGDTWEGATFTLA